MDPTEVSPELYATVFENDRVRVLKYRDQPGDCTKPHTHPDSVMVTLSSFRRRVSAGGRSVDVEIGAGQVRWVGAQEHTGENIGDTETVSFFIELKEPAPGPAAEPALGPSGN